MNFQLDVDHVNVVKILGIYFDDRICFDHYIDKTSSEVLQRIGVLSKKFFVFIMLYLFLITDQLLMASHIHHI